MLHTQRKFHAGNKNDCCVICARVICVRRVRQRRRDDCIGHFFIRARSKCVASSSSARLTNFMGSRGSRISLLNYRWRRAARRPHAIESSQSISHRRVTTETRVAHTHSTIAVMRLQTDRISSCDHTNDTCARVRKKKTHLRVSHTSVLRFNCNRVTGGAQLSPSVTATSVCAASLLVMSHNHIYYETRTHARSHVRTQKHGSGQFSRI